jgi:hypothetical protein
MLKNSKNRLKEGLLQAASPLLQYMNEENGVLKAIAFSTNLLYHCLLKKSSKFC